MLTYSRPDYSNEAQLECKREPSGELDSEKIEIGIAGRRGSSRRLSRRAPLTSMVSRTAQTFFCAFVVHGDRRGFLTKPFLSVGAASQAAEQPVSPSSGPISFTQNTMC